MAKLTKKLHYRRSATEYTIDLHDATANVGSNYITLKVDGSPAYAQLAAVGTPGNSHLRVRKSGNVYAVNATAQDPTMISSGGSVANAGTVVGTAPAVVYAKSFYADQWYSRVGFQVSPASALVTRFNVLITNHITCDEVHHFRIYYGTTSNPTSSAGTFTGTSGQTADLPVGTYYFKVSAEDSSNKTLYTSNVYGPVSTTYTTVAQVVSHYRLDSAPSGGTRTGVLETLTEGFFTFEAGTLYTTTQNVPVPAGVYYAYIAGVAGGGGGGGGARRRVRMGGGGGGAGQSLNFTKYAVTPGATIGITIGGGGAGGANWNEEPANHGNAGSAGGNTVITVSGNTITLAGGGGGVGAWSGYNDDGPSYANGGSGYPAGSAGNKWGGRGIGYDSYFGIYTRNYSYGAYGRGGRAGLGSKDTYPVYGGTVPYCITDGADYPGYGAHGQAGNAGAVMIIWQPSGVGQIGGSWVNSSNANKYYYVGAHSHLHPISGRSEVAETALTCGDACACNCNYCTCNCNYCPCDCNYCACNCNYSPCSCSSGSN
jgi:hypothetical protein